MSRFRSRDRDGFSDRVVAALRREFGGHAVVTPEEDQVRLAVRMTTNRGRYLPRISFVPFVADMALRLP